MSNFNGPNEQNKNDQSVAGCCGVIVLVLAAFVLWSMFSGSGGPRPTDISNEHFQSVANIIVSEGKGRVKVDPYDPSAPNTMRIYWAGDDMTAYQARKLATATRDRLGDEAIVYVKDDTGKTLGKASPWGVD